MSNISQIQPTSPPPVQTTSSEPGEKGVDFLVLRQLNKRARVRISKEPIDLSPIPSQASLFAVANSRGWFAAVAQDSNQETALVLSSLADLRSAFATVNETDEQTYVPQRKVSLGVATPKTIVFACGDSRLVVGLAEGSVIVYATEHLFSPGQGPVNPIYSLPAVPSAFIISISPNPGDLPDLVAILRDSQSGSNALVVELLDVRKLASVGGWVAGNSPSTIPTSISWSPKGKQLALGMRSGTIVTYAPTSTSTPKSSIPSPPSASNTSVISTTWLSASSFHAIYAHPPLNPDVEQMHFHVSLDAKTNSAQDLKFSSPYFPSPGLRPPGAFIVCLRGWDPAKTLLFVGDGTSSDIGVLGCIADDWSNLSLEETSTPSLPLDKDMNDTVLIGLELDLTSTDAFHHTSASGEGVKLPPSPVMYAYASDGTITGWHILNVNGTPYPGMVAQTSGEMETTQTLSAVPNAIIRAPSSDMNSSPTEPTPSATSAPTTTSPFAQTGSGFGQASAFGKQPSFGQTSFGQQTSSPFGQPSTTNAFGPQTTPAFGQQTASAFGQPASTSVFGKPSFDQPSTNSAFGQQTTSAFGQSSTADSIFGQQTTSVFGQPSTTSAFGKPSFGQPSFGQSSFGQPTSAFGATPSTASSFGQNVKFGFDTVAKPGGFGAFGTTGPSKFGQTEVGFGGSMTAATPPAATTPSPAEDSMAADEAPGFGGLSLGSTGAPKAADSKPSIFGNVTTQPSPSSTSSGGGLIKPGTGFGAFDQKQSPFGAFSGGSNTSAFGGVSVGASVFGSTTPASTSVFSSAAPANTSAFTSTAAPSSAFGKSGFGQSGFTQPTFGATGFGKSSFGATPVLPASTPTSGGFAAFAAGAPSAFAATASNASSQTKPVWAITSTSATKLDSPKPVFADAPRTAPESRSPSPVEQEVKQAAPTFRISAPALASTAPQSAFPAPSTGGFSAFVSGAGGGFAAFAGGQKSFGELLKQTGDEVKQPTEPAVKVFSEPVTPAKEVKQPAETVAKVFSEPVTPAKEVAKVEEPFTPTTPVTKTEAKKVEEPSTSTTPIAEPEDAKEVKEPSIPATPVPRADTAKQAERPPTLTTPVPKAEAAKEVVTPARTTTPPLVSEDKTPHAKGKEESLPQEFIEFISSSTASSFVDVSAEDMGAEESTVEDSDEESISDQTSDEQEVISEEESGELESEGEEGEFQQSESESPEPTAIPLPPSIPSSAARSRSTTPNAELPTITLSTTPPPLAPGIPPVKEQSTTPPGSPVAESQRTTSLIPQSLPKPPATSPFALTPRMGTRPVRSSPLSNAPLTGDTEAPTFLPPVSKSAPPAMAPHPALPRPQFGSLVKQDVETDSSSRPKTPPGLFGKNASVPATPPLPAFTPPPKPLPPSTSPSIFGGPAQTVTPPPVFSPPPASFLGFPSSPPTPPPHVPLPPSAFGMSMKTPATVPTFVPPPPGAFGSPQLSPAAPTAIPPSSGILQPTASPAICTPPTPPVEQSMQSECLFMLSHLAWELDNLKTMAARATQQAAACKLKKVPGQFRVKADLPDASKWMFGDIKEYGRAMTDLQGDIKDIKEKQTLLKKSFKELESSMLKAGTRKEEIIRFSRAQTDTEFARMLKVRTLGPEYLETQSQLRRDIRAMRDRVQKLEDHLQSSKKRLAELKTGKPSLRAPSLDTVNRTFRNIDIAIKQQSGDVAKLQKRMSQLGLSSNALGSRDKWLSESSVKKPLTVIPDVAVTTAAALNAERSAQKLKRTLLAARKEPLLNKSVPHPALPTSFQTPGRTVVKVAPETPTSAGPLSLPSRPLPAFSPGWSPETSVNYDDSPSYSASSRRPQRTSRHGTSAKSATMLKQAESLQTTPTPAPKPPSISFDWGPLPTATPKTMLSADVRPKSFRT